MEYIAHAEQKEDGTFKKHQLEDHLRKVAKLAESFAGEFKAGDWAYLAGLWHDLGKYRQSFQAYIRKGTGLNPEAHIEKENDSRTNHASSGAIYAQRELGKMGLPLSYMIAGHHAGLPDYEGGGEAPGAYLVEVLQRDKKLEKEALQAPIPDDIRNSPPPETFCLGDKEGFHLWVRMLFSCLVDADFLDTEGFYSPEKSEKRKPRHNLDEMLERFNAHMEELQRGAGISAVNEIRSDLLAQSRTKAKCMPGIFTMTIPTGGGKTLSSLAFALEHAVQYKKRRIIYAIPYTSIIEQTAGIFQKIFSSLGELVLEHHSNIEPDKADKENHWSRLATENWDAPLVVTTTVQLFESLFAARTSRCRKLHNLVNSVIVLDEAQLLPIRHLDPIRKVISLLSEHYGVTFVLSTATPTGLSEQTSPFGRKLLEGLKSNEIIKKPETYFNKLKRVHYELPKNFNATVSWESLVSELAQYESVLVVVNKRQDARELFELMPEGALHLSALMCAAHRSEVIKEIRKRLASGKPTKVISTQLVEAGVDFDFPVVYRAMAGLDSIVQSAGRCNREGRLESGCVVVFVPPTNPPPGDISTAIASTRSTLECLKPEANKLDQPETIERYFDHLFSQAKQLDSCGMEKLLVGDAGAGQVQFRTASKRFRLIDDRNTHTVYVRYKEAEDLLKELGDYSTRGLLRKLQRYSVTLYDYQFQEMFRLGAIEEIQGYFAQTSIGIYSKTTGLQTEPGNPSIII